MQINEYTSEMQQIINCMIRQMGFLKIDELKTTLVEIRLTKAKIDYKNINIESIQKLIPKTGMINNYTIKFAIENKSYSESVCELE